LEQSGEKRRAFRTETDIDAELVVPYKPAVKGVIADLSFMGCLFCPTQDVKVEPGTAGRLRFPLLPVDSVLESYCTVRNVRPNPTSPDVPALGFQFEGVDQLEEETLVQACSRWANERSREYHVLTTCRLDFHDGGDVTGHPGVLVEVSRADAKLRWKTSAPFDHLLGSELTLRLPQSQVEARIVTCSRQGALVEAALDLAHGWGRDFFVHEARRGSDAPRFYGM
jgi:hypothetical protein